MGRARELFARYERWVWIAVFAGILAYRWPLVKGYYYKFAHVAAPASSIAWRTDLNAALEESRRTHRPVLADFSASWCPPCIAMKHDVWPDPSIERAIGAGFVPLFVDVDRDEASSTRYQVDSIPTILVLDADGRVLRRAGYLPASGMRRFLAGE